MDYDSYDAVLHWIFRSTQSDAWFKPSEENISAGVCLRVEQGLFRVFPYENPFLAPFEHAVCALNPLVAVKVRSAAIHSALATVPEDAPAIYIATDARIQILDTIALLPTADKEQCGAFIRDERVLVVWSDDLDHIVPLCREFEDKLMRLVWRVRHSQTTPSLSIATSPSTTSPSAAASNINLTEKIGFHGDINPQTASKEKVSPNSEGSTAEEKDTHGAGDSRGKQHRRGGFSWSWRLSRKKRPLPDPSFSRDIEKAVVPERRPLRFFSPVYNGLGCGLSIFFIASGLSIALQEWRLDGDYTRFALLVAVPFLLCISLFFALQIITNISYAVGPVVQYHENSRYYSATKPQPNPVVDTSLPHVTIEMPVYKESLEETITPSIFSLKKAMQTYARQGGTSAIFVHDDGLQLLGEAEREKRIEFYADHNVGWVARPPHNSCGVGVEGKSVRPFVRAGRFKKASNMNYGLQISLLMENHLSAVAADEVAGENNLSNDHRGEIEGHGEPVQDPEERALELAVDEMWAAYGRDEHAKPWARNARALRLGEVILLVDSDTIVPEDCLRDAARELAESPEVAIIQHESDVMQVAHHYFENGITHFTRRINRCISMGCANGEVAPFVGHNAFLRWSALQDAAFVVDLPSALASHSELSSSADVHADRGNVPVPGNDSTKFAGWGLNVKIWSEENVSEDFDMALRLQLKGYTIRWATYSEGGFKEGVSLTVDDELNRWQKYAYGCDELIFNPLWTWLHRGPITAQLRRFLWSAAPVHYKLTMMSYMFSYYAIAGSAALSVLNYLVLGWALRVDGYYLHSFEIWLACVAVFPVAGNVGYTLLEYRLGKKGILEAALENVVWIPFFHFFFGGLSIHLSTALLAHLFSYDISWGATKKEVERSNFWIEVPRIFRRFWLAFLLCGIAVAGMIILSSPIVPPGWQVPGPSWAIILPLAIVASGHILFPIVLNPWLMIFSY